MKLIRRLILVLKIFFLSFLSYDNGTWRSSNFWIVFNSIKLLIISITHIILTFPTKSEKYKLFNICFFSFELLCVWMNWISMIIKRNSIVASLNSAKTLILNLNQIIDTSEIYDKEKVKCYKMFSVFNSYILFFFSFLIISGLEFRFIMFLFIRIFLYNFMFSFNFASELFLTYLRILNYNLAKCMKNESFTILSNFTSKFEKSTAYDKLSSEIDYLSSYHQKSFALNRELNESLSMITMVSLVFQFSMTVLEVKYMKI